ncbi:copper resistance CopC/CopD family protein [Homoserinibacter sp. GY 40078]|uniref:copper resistance CopC/CopD family protein n=1 Tax=Homoserinibacter sp. GY 40078 TaxID=2603275 RepID=UPI00164FF1C3|nr:copper resistance protein CopC [Homoserinibacter sp. GY 40078]
MTSGIRVSRWRAGRLLLAISACLLAVLLPAAPASAHADFLGSDPEDGAALEVAPVEATLRFSEDVTVAAGGIRLFRVAADPVPLVTTSRDGVVTVELPELADDARYVIAWEVVSVDSHPIAGTISFSVGDPPPGAGPVVPDVGGAATVRTAVLGTASALQYAAALLVSGLLFFEAAALRRRIGTRASRVVVLSGAALAAVAGAVVTVAAELTWQSLVSAALLVVSAVLVVVTVGRPRAIVPLTVSLLALVAPVLLGHSATTEPRALVVVSDLVHLAAGAVWFGGIIGMLLFLIQASRSERDRSAADAVSTAQVVARFSGYAAVAVGALIVSGTVMAVAILGGWAPLVETVYGLLLLMKLGVVAIALGVAGWNRVRLVPVVRARPTAAAAWRLMRAQLLREAAVVLVVLAATGFLTSQSPDAVRGGSAAATPASSEVAASADGVELSGEALQGDDITVLVFTLVDDDGAPIEPVEPPTVNSRLPSEDLGPFTVEAEPTGVPGEFRAEARTPYPGEWRITVGVRLTTFDQRTLLVETTVP